MHALLLYITTHIFTLLLLAIAYCLVVYFLFYADKSHYLIMALAVWFPFETIVLRYTPVDYYALVKYIPEIVLYTTALISCARYAKKHDRVVPRTPINGWLGLYIVAALVSLALNRYNPGIWILGVRQLTRFVLVFLIILWEEYSPGVIKRFVILGAAIAGFEAVLAIAQYASGGVLDKYLFFSDTVSLDGVQLEGLNQFWAPGQRVFGTLGRYDRLGSFLVIIALMAYPWLYRTKNEDHRIAATVGFGAVLLAILFTYSRASWVGCILGILAMAYFVVRDSRVVRAILTVLAVGAVLAVGVVVTGHYGGGVLDKQSQTISERLIEAVSVYSWQQNYEGYGRIFFIINTPLMVVSHYPLFGVGPGNYGGGVAAALGNTRMYDILHLPFGIQNNVGQIDNNWMSIWGEVGTLGLIAWCGLLVAVARTAQRVMARSSDLFAVTLAQGLFGATIAIMIFGFFGPYFEMRTLMMYFWLLAGVVFHYWREEKHKWNFVKE